MIFKDTYEHVKYCYTCQTILEKGRFNAQPLQPVMKMHHFSQWGLDFIRTINPPSSTSHRFILTAIDYCTKWTEACPSKQCTTEVVIKFLEEKPITRFGVPYALVCDNGPTFSSLKFSNWEFKYGITLKFSSNYYL